VLARTSRILVFAGLFVALAVAAAPAHGRITAFDCKRVVTPAEWRAVMGLSITVRYGENAHDCLWSHGRVAQVPNGGMSAYPAIYRIWHDQIYRDDRKPVISRPDWCEEVDQTLTRLTSFHGDFAWSLESVQYRIPGDSSCPATNQLVAKARTVTVVHHGRLLRIGSGDDFTGSAPRLGATMAQLTSLAHKAVRRF
jgi:hypothetical protein